jgi:putative thiamine transport system ATP-binding protein
MLELKEVTAWLNGAETPLFAPVSAVVRPGEILTIMGPSGLGKSTLLDVIGGHLAAGLRGAGEVWLNGKRLDDTPPQARRIGLLFQEAVLFPHLSVAGNLGFGLHLRGRSARKTAIAEALARVGLAGFEARDPATLSGGERTRVALMRMLLSRPKALLLDEPFAKLDATTRQVVRSMVIDHVRAAGVPTVLVTHDPEDAAEAQGTVLRL